MSPSVRFTGSGNWPPFSRPIKYPQHHYPHRTYRWPGILDHLGALSPPCSHDHAAVDIVTIHFPPRVSILIRIVHFFCTIYPSGTAFPIPWLSIAFRTKCSFCAISKLCHFARSWIIRRIDASMITPPFLTRPHLSKNLPTLRRYNEKSSLDLSKIAHGYNSLRIAGLSCMGRLCC